MERYRGFKLASRLLRVLAWVELVLGIVMSLVGGIAAGAAAGGAVATVIVLGGIFYSVVAWIFMLAAADIFAWLPDVEGDIRRIAETKEEGQVES